MKANPGKKSYTIHSLNCTCNPDRIVVDNKGFLYCVECMEKMDKVNPNELPQHDQDEIETKLRFQEKISKEEI